MADDYALTALRKAHVAKFDELCAFLAMQYGEDPNPANLSDERRAEIADEAEELTENWDTTTTLDDWDLEVRTELQRLLADHHAISERILDLQHEQAVKTGLHPEADEE
jgi:hypothetical protein